MEIIENLEKLLKEKGISAYKLEKDIGIKQTTFSSWKKGADPSASKLYDIMRYIGVSPNELFGYNESENLTENEKELLNIFRRLPDREQIKAIGRLEDQAEKFAAAPDPEQQKFIPSGAGEETG